MLARRRAALQDPAPQPGLRLVPRSSTPTATRRIPRRVSVLLSGAVYLLLLAAIGLLLAATLPGLLGYHTTIIYGGSMGRALPAGSVAVTQMVDASAVEPGDVIGYRRRDSQQVVFHRVVSIDDVDGRRIATTRGDANVTADPQPLTLTAKGERLVYYVPWVGYVLAFVRSPQGLASVVGAPVTVWLILLAGWRWRARRRAAEAAP